MKKTLLSVLTLAFFALTSQAQIVFKQVQVDSTGSHDVLPFFEVKNKVINQGTDSFFRWVKSENVPAGWTVQICDNIACYENLDSSDFLLLPNDSFYFKVNFTPNMAYGSGSCEVGIKSTSNPFVVNTANFTYTTYTASINKINANSIKLYPNPATDRLFIDMGTNTEPIQTVVVYDILGKVILKTDILDPKNSLNVSGLKQGVYIVKILQANQSLTKTFRKI